jgi:hypothetical protein
MGEYSQTRTTLEERLQTLNPTIQSICKVAGAPGISLAVIHNGKPIHRASFGFRDVENKKPVTGSTQFPIGTMAKTFTAAAVGALVAEGKLTWETPIKNIIPELHTASATVNHNLTIVDLLSHRAGLGRSNFWWQGADATLLLKKEDLLSYYNKLPITGQFRADWGYSNWGYALAGEVIERVSYRLCKSLCSLGGWVVTSDATASNQWKHHYGSSPRWRQQHRRSCVIQYRTIAGFPPRERYGEEPITSRSQECVASSVWTHFYAKGAT